MKKLIVLMVIIGTTAFAAYAQGTVPDEKLDKPVKIIHRTMPTYTEEARRRSVSGTVFMKVEFRSDATIGNVEYVSETSKKKELTKYGLVKNAIEAMRKTTFTPAIKDGQSITTSKVLESKFYIY